MIVDPIQTVVIGRTPGHQRDEAQVRGDTANIMASMEAFDLSEHQFLPATPIALMARIASVEIYTDAGHTERHRNEFARRVRAGEFRDSNEKLDFCLTSVPYSLRRKLLQVSLVAGAGFEPAAFRL